MKLLEIKDFRHEAGSCYVASLADTNYPGECMGSARTSSLRLFENGVEIGTAGASHEVIRRVGGGTYSHWENQLYFSTSNNTDPRRNGKKYVCIVPTDLHEEIAEMRQRAFKDSQNSDFLRQVLNGSVSSQGRELHAIYSLRALLATCVEANIAIDKIRCLEIGASPNNGLAIALGLYGASKVVVNNIAPIEKEVDVGFAQNIAFLANLLGPTKRALDEVMVFAPDGLKGKLNPEIYTVLGETDASEIASFIDNIDFIFSFSVLEHIRHLPAVMGVLRALASPKCTAIHFVDTRDHTSFAEPLKFLHLSETEFQSSYSDDHNRWRWPDYLRIFDEAGWNLLFQKFAGVLPVLPNGTTDTFEVVVKGPERIFVKEPRLLDQIITSGEIANLDKQFHGFSPTELSVQVFVAVLQPK